VAALPIRISEPVSAVALSRESGAYLVKLPRSGANLEDIEKELIIQALEFANGNKTKAAKLLKTSRDTLRYKVKKYALE
jgi:DNA-binding NtrC family response regulator